MCRRASIVGAVVAFVASGCSTTYFTVQRRAPAEVNIPSGVPMAVGSVTGTEGDALASELTQALLETRRFQLLERQHLAGAIAELRFSAEGFVSDDTAISFGEMTGAATVVVGAAHVADYVEVVDQKAQTCARDGQTVDCVLFTRTARATLQVSLHVVETKTGHLLAAKTLKAARERAVQLYDRPPDELAARAPLMSECRTEVVQGFVRVVAPHDVTELVALRIDDELPELEAGSNYARAGNWSAAVAQYRAAAARAAEPPFTAEQRAAALYDLGIGLGYSGDFDAGVAELERAYALDPDDLYREQIAVLRRYQADAVKMAEQERPGAP